jgi:carboxypeptidase T
VILRTGFRLGRSLLAFVLLAANLTLPSPARRVSADLRPPGTPVLQAPNIPQAYLVRVYFNSLADRDKLASELDAQETSTAGGYITAIVDDAQYQALQAAGRRVEIDQGRTALLNQPAQRLAGQAGGIPGFPCYRTVEETYASLAQLAGRHPNLASWVDAGDSWKKVTSGGAAGYDLNVLVLTNKSRPGPKPVFFLMAAIHAREYATAEIATRYAEYLVGQYGLDPDVTWLLDYFQVVIMPQANPDGRKLAEAGFYQRKNVNNTNGGSCFKPPSVFDQYGTDLNRNSSFQWGGDGSSSYPCDQVYHGPGQASEPETQAIQNEMASLFPDRRGRALTDTVPVTASGVFITLHSYGELDLFPWGFTPDPAPNSTALQTLARKFGYYNGYTVCQAPVGGCLYTTSGTTDDWAYGELGVASYTFEVGTDFFESCDNFESTIWPANRPALLYALKAARLPYQSPAGPETIQVTTTVRAVNAGRPLTLTAVADDTRYASGGPGVEPAQNIAAARYSVDAPSWITATTTYSLTVADGAFDASTEILRAEIDTTGWAPGDHLVYVESQDAAGNWGVPSATFVTIIPPYALATAPASAAAAGLPGTTVTYTLNLTQVGYLTDTYTVTVTGNVWPTNFAHSLGPLTQGQTAPLTVTVMLPLSAIGGAHDPADVTITSVGDPTRQALIKLLTTALPYRLLFPVIGR